MILYATSNTNTIDIKQDNIVDCAQFWRYHAINIHRYNTTEDYDNDNFEVVRLDIDNRYVNDELYIDIYFDAVSEVIPIAILSVESCTINRLPHVETYVYNVLFELAAFMVPQMFESKL